MDYKATTKMPSGFTLRTYPDQVSDVRIDGIIWNDLRQGVVVCPATYFSFFAELSQASEGGRYGLLVSAPDIHEENTLE